MTMGKWLEANKRSASTMFICSECGEIAYYIHGKGRGKTLVGKYCGYKYCPNCGVKMERKEE